MAMGLKLRRPHPERLNGVLLGIVIVLVAIGAYVLSLVH